MDTHETVLRREAIDALVVEAGGRYIDCTYGRGGHSAEIARRLSHEGRMLVIDRDPAAIRHAQDHLGNDGRVTIVHGDYARIAEFARDAGMLPVDGVLLDLGVSSPQIDNPERGFSFMTDGPLDMRMDTTAGVTAAEWLARAPESEISQVLSSYGEERFARRIARRIVEQRDDEPLATTRQLVALIEAAIPMREKHKHPATRSFQAIRIQVNRELAALETCLEDIVDLLATGGRLVVISFHSLEDRIVKRFIRRMEKGPELPRRLPIPDAAILRRLKAVGRAIKPTASEIEANPRSRSSIMRVAEKVA